MDEPQTRLQHLVLRAGIELETFWERWLSQALEELTDLPTTESPTEENEETDGPDGSATRPSGPND